MKVAELIRQLVISAEQCEKMHFLDVEFGIQHLGEKRRYGKITDIDFGYDESEQEVIRRIMRSYFLRNLFLGNGKE